MTTTTDLRGTPKGEADHRRVERLVLRSPRNKRRTREVLDITFCAAGFHSTSGSAIDPSGDEICQCIFDLGARGYREQHADRPVVWRVRRSGPLHRAWSFSESWCDERLPDEYREMFEQAPDREGQLRLPA